MALGKHEHHSHYTPRDEKCCVLLSSVVGSLRLAPDFSCPLLMEVGHVAVAGGPGWLWLSGSDVEHELFTGPRRLPGHTPFHMQICPVQTGSKQRPTWRRSPAHVGAFIK